MSGKVMAPSAAAPEHVIENKEKPDMDLIGIWMDVRPAVGGCRVRNAKIGG
jgi:hypothetical protein